VVELHGNIMVTRCTNRTCSLEPFHDEHAHRDVVPKCPKCNSVLRPDVVLFGEEIPAQASWSVKRELRDCDLFIARNIWPRHTGSKLRQKRRVRRGKDHSC
jgi:NAD-dependent deacetylase